MSLRAAFTLYKPSGCLGRQLAVDAHGNKLGGDESAPRLARPPAVLKSAVCLFLHPVVQAQGLPTRPVLSLAAVLALKGPQSTAMQREPQRRHARAGGAGEPESTAMPRSLSGAARVFRGIGEWRLGCRAYSNPQPPINASPVHMRR